jgi:hypothetical protein
MNGSGILRGDGRCKLARMDSRRLFASLVLIVGACGEETLPNTDYDPEERIVPLEVADAEALARLGSWSAMATLGDARYEQQSTRDRGLGGSVPIPLLANENRDMNNYICHRNATGPVEGGLVEPLFDEGECAEPYVRGFVFARFEGSGALSRLAMTMLSISTGDPPFEEVLRIWVDDQPTPILQVRIAELLDGSAGEIFAPPFGSGAPTHLNWYYPLVFSSKLVVAIDKTSSLDVYYAVAGAQLDASPRSREAADAPLVTERQAARNLLELRGSSPVSGLVELADAMQTAPAGMSAIFVDLAGGGTIHELELRAPNDSLDALPDLTITLEFDERADLRSTLPLLALWNAERDDPSTSLVLESRAEATEKVYVLRLPMPYESAASVRVDNDGPVDVDLRFIARGDSALPPAPTGKLVVEYRETLGPTTVPYHPLARVTGRGRHVATCTVLEGHGDISLTSQPSGFNFLEGDEMGVIDGLPSLMGTGTEDYFDGSFYFAEGEHVTAFSQCYGIDEDLMAMPATGAASLCRFHILHEAIDFQTSFDFDLEIGGGTPQLLDRYRSTAFRYVP